MSVGRQKGTASWGKIRFSDSAILLPLAVLFVSFPSFMAQSKPIPKKAISKKGTPKKATPKKTTPKKAAPIKAAPKKVSPEKAAPKKVKPEKNKSLESWIWDAACSIRGAKDAPKYKDFILPLIFTKRLCDVFDDELNRIAAQVGSRKKAFQLAKADHKLVRFYLPLMPGDPEQPVWSVIRKLSDKIGGRMKSLYFGASLAPRIEQAASQIQDSRDLFFSGLTFLGAAFSGLTFLGAALIGAAFLGVVFFGVAFLGVPFLDIAFLGMGFDCAMNEGKLTNRTANGRRIAESENRILPHDAVPFCLPTLTPPPNPPALPFQSLPGPGPAVPGFPARCGCASRRPRAGR